MQGFWTGWAEYILEVSFIVDLSLPVGFDDWSRTLLKRGGSARLRVLALFEVFYVSIDKLEPTVSFNFYLGGKWSPSKVISSLFCPLLKLQLPPIHPSRPIDFEKSLLRLYNQSTTPSTNSDNYKLSPQSISGALIWIIYISCEKKKKIQVYQPTVFVSSAEAASPPSHSASMMPILAAGGCFTPRNLNLGSASWKRVAQSSASRSFALWNSNIAKSMLLFDLGWRGVLISLNFKVNPGEWISA